MTEVFKIDSLATEFRFHLFSLSKRIFIKKFLTFKKFIPGPNENDDSFFHSLKHTKIK